MLGEDKEKNQKLIQREKKTQNNLPNNLKSVNNNFR